MLPPAMILDQSHYRAVPLSMRPDSIGWHGNALLVKREIEVTDAAPVPLPVLEPRGAIRADLLIEGRAVRVVGMHLDLSGIRRRHQVRAVLSHIAGLDREHPTVLMGDFNEWAQRGGCFREFGERLAGAFAGAELPRAASGGAARSRGHFARMDGRSDGGSPQRLVGEGLGPSACLGGLGAAQEIGTLPEFRATDTQSARVTVRQLVAESLPKSKTGTPLA